MFFSFSIVALSCVSVNKDATISGRVISVRVPYIVHIFNVFKFSRLGKLLRFVCYNHSGVRPSFPILVPIVSMILSIQVVQVVSIWKSFSSFLLSSDHFFYCALEFFIASWVLFVEILKLSLG
jgi:hypothetical protein